MSLMPTLNFATACKFSELPDPLDDMVYHQLQARHVAVNDLFRSSSAEEPVDVNNLFLKCVACNQATEGAEMVREYQSVLQNAHALSTKTLARSFELALAQLSSAEELVREGKENDACCLLISTTHTAEDIIKALDTLSSKFSALNTRIAALHDTIEKGGFSKKDEALGQLLALSTRITAWDSCLEELQGHAAQNLRLDMSNIPVALEIVSPLDQKGLGAKPKAPKVAVSGRAPASLKTGNELQETLHDERIKAQLADLSARSESIQDRFNYLCSVWITETVALQRFINSLERTLDRLEEPVQTVTKRLSLVQATKKAPAATPLTVERSSRSS